MPPKTLPHVKRVVTKGRVYLFFNTGQKRAGGATIYAKLPAIDDPAFPGRYAALCAGRTKRAAVQSQLTVPAFADKYRASVKFKQLSPASRQLYGYGLDKLCALLPTAPAREVNGADMRDLIDTMADTPGAANAFLRTVGALYAWGRSRALVANEPTRGIEALDVGEHEPWPEAMLAIGLACDDPRTRLAVHMLYFTAQRIGDVLRARWSDLKGDAWPMVQQKTGKPLTIPLHRDLKVELARHKPTGPFLFDVQAASVRKDLKALAKAHGYSVVPHGLRKNAVIALLEAGCSTAETASITGQSLKMVEHYARGINQRRMGDAAILKWEARK